MCDVNWNQNQSIKKHNIFILRAEMLKETGKLFGGLIL